MLLNRNRYIGVTLLVDMHFSCSTTSVTEAAAGSSLVAPLRITKAGETDMARATTTDTYAIWALAEARADQNSDEINRLKESATESANAIQNRAYRILTNKKIDHNLRQIGFGGQL
jgi:hypothetical protein